MHLKLIGLEDIVECAILERLSRFTVKVVVGGAEAIAYLSNTGRLRGYLTGGRRGFCVRSRGGRHGYRLVGVEDTGLATLIDTKLHEKSFEILVTRNLIPWLRGCEIARRNVRAFRSTIDYLIRCENLTVFVEVKSAVARAGEGLSSYPDAPTDRGRRQIWALAEVARGGGRALVVFVAGIPKAKGFRLSCEEYRDICSAIKGALEAGVEFKAVNVFLDPESKSVVAGDLDLPVDLGCCTS